MQSKIPVKNIYYLLCYSWNTLAEGDVVDVSAVDSTELADLFASVLIAGTNHLLRRGLAQEYKTYEDDLASIRGRIDVATSARKQLLQHGKARCIYDELSVNTLPNRLIKSTVRHLSLVPDLDNALRKQLRLLYRELNDIDDVRLSRLAFRRVQLRRNARYYKFLLSICEIVAGSWLIDETTGEHRFRDFLRDPRQMARLYENFIHNFYQIERPDLDVRREVIKWMASSEDDKGLLYLPTMRTDISVRDGKRTLIIDAKYYREIFGTYHESERIHSGNLYQLFAYVKNLEARGGPDAKADGMLLYPAIDRKIRLSYEVQGHCISVCTLDLAQEWRNIRKELLDLVADFGAISVQESA
ncbi:MAG: 5-methylcytosine-specific restriction endonuclease system specificity protein McrC [Planctomycetota bacterium]|jgi:5-methylcytosine-specific restriction enzyme subunit McrC